MCRCAARSVGPRAHLPWRPGKNATCPDRARRFVFRVMDEAGGLLRARSVSFSPARDHIQPECAQGVDSSQDLRRSPSAGIPKKSAMKQGNQMRLPPAAWYQHPDPLVRRLRLVDGHGKHVNLKQEFRDVKLVLFYFGSQWSVQNSKKCSSVGGVSHLDRIRPRAHISSRAQGRVC